jgi:hypothetical protein
VSLENASSYNLLKGTAAEGKEKERMGHLAQIKDFSAANLLTRQEMVTNMRKLFDTKTHIKYHFITTL